MLPRAAGEPETRRYRDVICASGTLSTPKLPDIPGEFAGEYRHSSTYRGIDELRGKRVLIIGAGDRADLFARRVRDTTSTSRAA